MDTNLIYMAAVGAAGYAAIHFSTRRPGSGGGIRAWFADWRERTFGYDPIGATDDWADEVGAMERYDGPQDGYKKRPSLVATAVRAAWDVATQPWQIIASPVDVEATLHEPIAVHHVAPVHIMTPAEMEEARWAAEWARVDDILEHDCRRSDSALFKYEGVREAYDEIHRRDDMSFVSVLREDAASITRMLVMIEAHLAVAETMQMVGV